MSTTNPSAQTALLVMDVQLSTVERYAQNSDLLPRLATTIAAARTVTIPVIYVRVKFRQGYPEVSPRNKMFAGIKQRSSSFQDALMAMEIHPAIAPLPTDSVVTKLRVSAFALMRWECGRRFGRPRAGLPSLLHRGPCAI